MPLIGKRFQARLARRNKRDLRHRENPVRKQQGENEYDFERGSGHFVEYI